MEFFLWLTLIVLLIVYIRKTNELSRQITDFEVKLDRLQRKISAPAPQAAPPPIPAKPEEKITQPIAPTIPEQPARPPVSPPPVAAKLEEKIPPPLVPKIPVQPAPATEPLASRPPISSPPPKSLPPVAPPPRPSRTRAEWEALIGGKLLNRIGAVALILGIGFFLKYAFDNNLISETMRVAIGFATGAGVLFLGNRTHKKELQIFAQGLFGAGISILYLSVYASFNFYHLVPQMAAFGLMALVTALAFFYALKYDSLAISFLGWAGGFLTPIMLSTGQANEVGLFTYIALLDAGLLAVLFRKQAWVILEPLTLAATYAMYFLWYREHYQPENLPVAILFLTIFWGLFYGLDVVRFIKGAVTFPQIRQAVAGANAIFYCTAMYAIIDPAHHAWMSPVMLAIAAVYFLTFLGLKQRRPEGLITLVRYALTAITLLIWATEIQFDGFNTVIFWSLEALILVWCGLHWNLRYVWQAALGLLGLALPKLLLTQGAFKYFAIEDFTLIFNHRALAFALLAATLGASAVFFKRVEEEIGELIRAMLHAGWSILLFMLLTVEINDFFRQRMLGATEQAAAGLAFNRFMTWAASWLIYSLPLVWLGLRRKILPILCTGLCVLGLAILVAAIPGLTFRPLAEFTVVLNWRAAVLVLVIAGTVVHNRWLKNQRQTYDWIASFIPVLQTAIALLLFELCTVEVNDFFRRRMIDATGEIEIGLAFNRSMAWAAIWTIYSLPLVWLGLRRKILPFLYAGLGGLGLAVVIVALQGLAFRPIAEFTVVLNWRVAVFALVIAGAVIHTRWLQSHLQTYDWAGDFVSIIRIAMVLLLFELGTVEVNDYFRRRMMDATGETEIGLAFNRFMTWATVWTIYSLPLVWLGLRRKILPFLYAGLGGLGLAAVMVALQGIAFRPIAEFTVVLNWRVAVFALVIAGAFFHARWLQNHLHTYGWAGDFISVVRIAMVLLLFELCTVEVNDFFRQRMAAATGEMTTGLAFTRFMTWAAIWMVYSLPLAWFGLRRQVLPILYIGFGMMGLAVLTVATQGLTFDALSQFTPALNARAFVFILVIAGVVIHARWLQDHGQSYPWSSKALGILQVALVLLILDLLTGETRDIFRRALFSLQQKTGVAGVAEEIIRLRNLQQLVLSGVWLLYSVVLMVAGIWRRMQGLRLIAIILFGVTILKIFIYDLSFLQTLYRIYSFIGLGVILLAVSYLYQRYKAVIFEVAAK